MRHGKAGRGLARRGRSRLGAASPGVARQGPARPGKARQGWPSQANRLWRSLNVARHGTAGLVRARQDKTRLALAGE
jgi:hypothetical protein